MNFEIERTRYSVFGQFLHIEATSKTIGDIFENLKAFDFVPSTLNMLQFSAPAQEVKIVNRPQFINPNIGCVISILPDRIDIEFQSADFLKLENNFETMSSFLLSLSKVINIASNRLAINTTIKVASEEQFRRIYDSIIGKSILQTQWDVAEIKRHELLNPRIVLFDEVSEIINVNIDFDYSKLLDIDNNPEQKIQVSMDINTKAEQVDFRFETEQIIKGLKSLKSISDGVLL